MTKATMIQELANAGMQIFGERKMLKADVERYYNTRFTKEENTVTTVNAQNPVNEVTSTNPETKKVRKSRIRKVVLTDTIATALQRFAASCGLTYFPLKKGDGITLKAKGQGNVAKLYWSVGGFDLYLKTEVDTLIQECFTDMNIPYIRHENSKYNKDMNWYTVSGDDLLRVLTVLA